MPCLRWLLRGQQRFHGIQLCDHQRIRDPYASLAPALDGVPPSAVKLGSCVSPSNYCYELVDVRPDLPSALSASSLTLSLHSYFSFLFAAISSKFCR